MGHVLRYEIPDRERLRDDVENDDADGRGPEDAAVVACRGHVVGVYESSRGSPVTVAGAARELEQLSDSVSSPHSTHASRNAPRLTAMSATLNVGHRESPNPMSMKSTTPAARQIDAIDQIADRAAADERERQRPNRRRRHASPRTVGRE